MHRTSHCLSSHLSSHIKQTESTVRSDLILIVQADVFAGECLDGWNIAAGQYRYSGCSLRGHHCCWSCNGTLVVPLHSHPPSIYNRVTPTTLPLLLLILFTLFCILGSMLFLYCTFWWWPRTVSLQNRLVCSFPFHRTQIRVEHLSSYIL